MHCMFVKDIILSIVLVSVGDHASGCFPLSLGGYNMISITTEFSSMEKAMFLSERQVRGIDKRLPPHSAARMMCRSRMCRCDAGRAWTIRF